MNFNTAQLTRQVFNSDPSIFFRNGWHPLMTIHSSRVRRKFPFKTLMYSPYTSTKCENARGHLFLTKYPLLFSRHTTQRNDASLNQIHFRWPPWTTGVSKCLQVAVIHARPLVEGTRRPNLGNFYET